MIEVQFKIVYIDIPHLSPIFCDRKSSQRHKNTNTESEVGVPFFQCIQIFYDFPFKMSLHEGWLHSKILRNVNVNSAKKGAQVPVTYRTCVEIKQNIRKQCSTSQISYRCNIKFSRKPTSYFSVLAFCAAYLIHLIQWIKTAVTVAFITGDNSFSEWFQISNVSVWNVSKTWVFLNRLLYTYKDVNVQSCKVSITWHTQHSAKKG